MTTARSVAVPSAPGMSRAVLGAGLVFAVTAALVGVAGSLPGASPQVMLVAGWPAFALAGGVLLDVQPDDPLARRTGVALVVLALLVPVDLVWATLRAGGPPTSSTLGAALAEVAAAQVVGLGFAASWAFHPSARRTTWLGLAVAALGAVLTGPDATRPLGWALVVVGWVAHVTTLALVHPPPHRQGRRRLARVHVALVVAGLVVAGSWWLLPRDLAADATGFGLWALAIALTRLATVEEFRPSREVTVDLLVALGALGAAALVGTLLQVGASLTHLDSPTTFATFGALVTAVFAVPAGLRVRRTVLARRYGSGTLSPADVADLTADLHARTEPRELLERAARMVATASGSPAVRIVLDAEPSPLPERWAEHPLVVGGDRVGGLLVESAHPEGPERRQRQVVDQLLPTVALVARAVGLAVEAEHARRDGARERDAERARILSDLHDGLGPVLAGMSMRVRAGLRTAPPAYAGLLHDLATDLATSRTDLRRIVAGITPSTLDDGDLAGALTSLVRSFGEGTGPAVSLDVRLERPVPGELQVAVYRCVAEGITNALRHARPGHIAVAVRSDGDDVLAEVLDDGAGGVVVPGVGLASLARRAEAAGGHLFVSRRDGAGTCLRMVLPLTEAAAR